MDIVKKIKDYLDNENIFYETDVNLKTKTWIKRGGIASIWIQPSDMNLFEKIIVWCQKNYIEAEIIGNTSNCYFLNYYNPLLVVSTIRLKNMRIDGNYIICDCGYNMSQLSRYCIYNGISGFEGFVDLPGTVGGAAINNSGCYGSLTSNVVESVLIIKDGERKILTNNQLQYSHRNSILKSKRLKAVVLSVKFKIENKEDPRLLKARAKTNQYLRKKFQETKYPNLGTTFNVLQLKKDSYLALHNKKFKRYISEYGIQCFTWKDEGADDAFIDYLNFIKQNAIEFSLEIDIKDDKKI